MYMYSSYNVVVIMYSKYIYRHSNFGIYRKIAKYTGKAWQNIDIDIQARSTKIIVKATYVYMYVHNYSAYLQFRFILLSQYIQLNLLCL